MRYDWLVPDVTSSNWRCKKSSKISFKKSKLCDYVQNQVGRPSRYVKTGGKNKRDRETQRTERNTPRDKKRYVREEESIALCHMSRRPGRELHPDDCAFQEHRRLDEDVRLAAFV